MPEDKLQECPNCGYMFHSWEMLETLQHPETGEDVHVCDRCYDLYLLTTIGSEERRRIHERMSGS